MKRWKTGFVLVLLGILLFLMAGCGSVMDDISEALDDPQTRQKTEAMLDCLLTDDVEGAKEQFQGLDVGADFPNIFDQLRGMLTGVEDYTLQASYIQKNVTNGVSSQCIRYLLTAGERQYWVEAVETEGYAGLTGFHIYEVTTQNGTLGAMEGTNATQWVLLIVGMLEIGFVLWMLIDCCCRKVSKKWLWILAILLGSITWILTVTPQRINLNFNYGLFFSYTALICYSTGGFALRVYMPIGAVVYLCLRKMLLKKAQEPETPAMSVQPVQEIPQTEISAEVEQEKIIPVTDQQEDV